MRQQSGSAQSLGEKPRRKQCARASGNSSTTSKERTKKVGHAGFEWQELQVAHEHKNGQEGSWEAWLRHLVFLSSRNEDWHDCASDLPGKIGLHRLQDLFLCAIWTPGLPPPAHWLQCVHWGTEGSSSLCQVSKPAQLTPDESRSVAALF